MAIIPTTIRLPDGSLGQVNFDTATGQQVNQTAPANPGSRVQTNDSFTSDLNELGLAPTETAGAKPPKPTTAQTIVQQPREEIERFNGGNRASEAGHGNSDQAGLANFGRTASNNYGYINRPGAMGFAGMLPGPLGTAGTVVNAAIGASNTAATNIARESIGLEKVGLGRAIGNMIKDQKGQVADINVGSRNYSVGLEALDSVGRTTLTPDEANRRAVSNATNIVETPSAQAAANRAEFTRQNGGFFARAKQGLTDIFNSVFGEDVQDVARPSFEDTARAGMEAAQNTTPAGRDTFAPAPNRPSGSDTNWGGMSQSQRDHARGMSGQVAGAIERGSAGLY